MLLSPIKWSVINLFEIFQANFLEKKGEIWTVFFRGKHPPWLNFYAAIFPDTKMSAVESFPFIHKGFEFS